MVEKTLKIYKENNEFVVERINQFNHATKRRYLTENGLKEALKAYKPVLSEYDIDASDEIWSQVLNYLVSNDFQKE